jgi:hypothetical protein
MLKEDFEPNIRAEEILEELNTLIAQSDEYELLVEQTNYDIDILEDELAMLGELEDTRP